MPPIPSTLNFDAVEALTAMPAESCGHSPLGDTPWLAFELPPPHGNHAATAAWLRQLPCPVIGIGTGADTALLRACDVVLSTATELEALLRGIEARPLAAAVLVQLLRLTPSLPLADALVAESLAYATVQNGAEFRRWLATQAGTGTAPAREDGPAVLIERSDAQLRLTLNRPANRNAMSVEMRDALVEALGLALADDSIAGIRIDARGKCFSTGGDVSEFGTAPDATTAHAVRGLALPGRWLARCAARATVRVHGACIGSGIEFPSFAARIEATPDAWFQLPELKYGLIPGAGGCVGIAARIGRQRTAWMALSGRRIDARTALAWGLVDAIVEAP